MNSPMSKAEIAELHEAAEQTALEFSHYDRFLLSLAANVAGGMAANPNIYEGRDFENEIASRSYSIAQKIMRRHLTGGC